MLFQKKIDRAMEWLKEKNNPKHDSETNEEWKEDDFKIEKGDIPAIIISALIVFGPLLIFLFIIMFLLI